MFWKDRSIDRQNFGDQILLFLDFFSSLHFASFCGGIKTYSALTERIFFVISVLFRLFSAQTLNREATAMFCSSKGLENINIGFRYLSEKNVTQRLRFTEFILSSRKLSAIHGTTRANHNHWSIFLRKDCILPWESQVLTRLGD